MKIDKSAETFLMTRRRDVEALLAAKLDPRHQEVELDAMGMRVPHP